MLTTFFKFLFIIIILYKYGSQQKKGCNRQVIALKPRVSTPVVVQWLSYSPLDPRFAGSIPTGVDGIFQSVKILIMNSFGREVKPWVPCRRFTARKRTQAEIRAS